MTATIHIIDDDDAVRDSLDRLLGLRGWRTETYDSALGFLGAPRPPAQGCILTDVQMPGMSGLALLPALRSAGLDLPVIVMTGRAERDMAQAAVRDGAAAFLDKPFTPTELLALVDRVLSGSDARA